MKRSARDLKSEILHANGPLFYDLIKQSLETNIRLTENLATFMKAAQSMSAPRAEPKPSAAPNGTADSGKAPARAGQRWVYGFGGGAADGAAAMRNLLGGKGANLAEMANLGLPVPPGFTITTEVCTTSTRTSKQLSRRARGAGRATRWRREIGKTVGKASATPANPLLVSVRSGARASMPGMMDTVLNLGLNDADGRGPRRSAPATRASPTTAIAASSRCIRDVVLGVDHDAFEDILDEHKDRHGYQPRHRARRRRLAKHGRRVQGASSSTSIGKPFPQDPQEQLWGAIGAVFGSLDERPRAVTYRRLQRHSRELGHGGQRPGDGVRQHGRDLAPPASPSPAIPSTGDNAASTASS